MSPDPAPTLDEDIDPMKLPSMPEDDPNGNVNSVMGAAAPRWGPQHAGAKALASMYSKEKRFQEQISVVVASVLFVLVFVNLLRSWDSSIWEEQAWLSSIFWSTNDERQFCSGIIVGSVSDSGVKTSPKVNGDNFMLCIPNLAHILYQQITMNQEQLRQWASFHWYILLLGIYVAMTNQREYPYDYTSLCARKIHKWSHTYFNLSRFVIFLQKAHIILPRSHHKIHHIAPHACYYCITTGWLNYPLEYVGFWRKAEFMVTALTGMKPREDDLKWATKLH
ncbi:hypothetical protein DICVIV_00430 [Dictyocaulus viviparus]|uniref:Lipid desaturase domain-containing protein n=1 Tax=Dictyocaulus viviparus TaxID=29172 RepID=A0A0D8YAU3_DICVI|nr:hypothetical protein DICVIV_00430 [Dictyocaulus viviparus]